MSFPTYVGPAEKAGRKADIDAWYAVRELRERSQPFTDQQGATAWLFFLGYLCETRRPKSVPLVMEALKAAVDYAAAQTPISRTESLTAPAGSCPAEVRDPLSQ